MQNNKLPQIHEIRKSWQTTRTQMFLTCQKINEIEESLSQAKAVKRLLQQKLTELEILEKELIGNIKPIKPTKTVFKTSLEKAITSFVKNAFGHLSKEELGSEYCYIVPTCDTLSSTQIHQLLKNTTENLFLRNVEPSTLIKSTQDIVAMCKFGNLYGIHVPIQSLNSKVLESMNRNPDHVYESLYFLKWLKEKYHVKIATNIINGFDNIIGGYEPKIDIYKLFDHVAVNPYWDGIWDIQKAENRMLQFVPQYKVNII